jgi:tetratricopeptide (TPR) repeat protein
MKPQINYLQIKPVIQIKKLLIVLLLQVGCFILPASVYAGNEDIQVAIDYSIDNGKTFQDRVVVTPGGSVSVRASWDYIRPDGSREPYLIALYSTERDFSSANVGLQRWGGKKAWYQKQPPGYISARKQSIVLKMNFAARKAGTMGYRNKWNKIKRKFVNGPLPACTALPVGTHNFTLTVYYRDSKRKKISGQNIFQITIGDNKATAKVAQAPIVKKEYKTLLFNNPKAEYILPAENIINLSGKNRATVSNGMVRVRTDLLGWIIDKQLTAQPYYLSWTVQSGSKHGMELLDKKMPFLYLNGKPIVFDYARGPQKHDRNFITQIQSNKAIYLKPGDHLRISKLFNNGLVGELRLYKQALKPAPVRVRGFVELLNDKATELNYKLVSQTNNEVKASASIRNMTNKVQSYKVQFIAKNWWQTPIKEAKSTVSVPPYQSSSLTFTFPLKNTTRYTSTVNITLKDGHKQRETIDIQHSISNARRSFMWLSKGWNSYLVDSGWNSPTVPQGKTGSRLDFPGMFYRNKNKTRLFRKEFTLTDAFQHKKIMLDFSGAGDEIQIWLNGKTVLSKQNLQRAPFQIDVTDAVNLSGINSLAMVSSKTSRLALRDIFIEAMPKQHIAAILVTPSFRNRNIALNISTANAKSLTLSGEISYLGKPVLKIPPFKLNKTQHNIKIAWNKPILWDIENPRLLQLNLALKNSAGKIVDSKATRFGFREIWVEGFNVMLNGKPQRFRAIAMNGGYFHSMVKNKSVRDRIRLRKKLGINFLRHVYQAGAYAAIADEEGIFMAQGVLTVSHPTVEKLHGDKLWRDKDRLSCEIVLNLYNHPSIVEWYISNEFSESLQKDSRTLAIKRLITSQEAIKKIDDSRLFGHGCDLDLGGYNAFYSTHYPVDIHGLRSIEAYTPDVCLWHKPDQPLTRGMKVPNGQINTVANVHFKSPLAWGTKPIFVGEFGWNMFYNPPVGFMQIFGDKVISSVWEVKKAHHQVNAMFNAGHREAEVALYTTWDHAANHPYRYVPKIDIYLWNQSHAWYGNSKITIPMNIFHEIPESNSYKLTVSLDGKTSKQTILDKNITLNAIAVYRNTFSFKTPNVSTETAYKMRYLLKKGNKIIAKKTVDVEIYPRTIKPLLSTAAILIYDPSSQLEKQLAELSLTVKRLASLDKLSSLTPQPLIIAKNALNNATETGIKQLEEYVYRGGRVLVLQQQEVHGLFNMSTTPKVSSIAFKRAFNEPETAGFSENDFKYWYKGHVVSRYDYRKPKGRAGTPLLETGSGMGGLAYTPLFKLTDGNGVCYLNQMDLLQAYRQSPVADKLFRSLLSGIINFKPSEKKFGTFVKKESPLERFLKKLALTVDNSQPLSLYNAIICDADLLANNNFRAKVKSYLNNGGTVYFKNVNFTNQRVLSAVLGSELSFAKNNLPAVKGRALILEHDPVLDGISQEDFFWRRWQENESTAGSFRTDKDFLANPSDLQGIIKGGKALIYPNSLIRVKSGAGVAYLDMLRWEQAPLLLKRKASRIAMSLLYNLGAKFKTRKVSAINLKNVGFDIVKLKPFFNRSLIDLVDNDGQGGWNDQGPEHDMRGIPTGRQTFNRIPFLIAKGKNCITLHSKYRKAKLPYKIKIPINRKVKGLAFLYTSAWTGSKEHGAYNVHYRDGSSYLISLAGGKTLRDWAAAQPGKAFPNENEIQTELAYTCRTAAGRKASLFQLIWTNSRPASEVSYLSFETTDNAVMALLSITALTASKSITIEQHGNPEVSAAFYRRGLSLYKKQKYNLAVKSFKSAIRASNKNYPAYLLAGDIYKIQKKYPAAEKILLALIAKAPNQLEAYVKLGAIYEQQGKYREALAIYRKSFKVEKNQPWIMHAIERLNNKLSR